MSKFFVSVFYGLIGEDHELRPFSEGHVRFLFRSSNLEQKSSCGSKKIPSLTNPSKSEEIIRQKFLVHGHSLVFIFMILSYTYTSANPPWLRLEKIQDNNF